MNRLAVSVAWVLVLALGGGSAIAADLRLLIANGMKPVMHDAGPLFERATGHKLSIHYDGSAILQQAIARGDAFDVVVTFAPNLDASTKLGRIDSTSRVEIARSGLGVVIRADLPKPNIATVAGFRKAMLDARSIAYASRGASGRHFVAVCERLGIADQVKAKSKTRPTGNVAELVAIGEAEIAVQQMSELIGVEGTALVGPFPAELDLVSLVVAATSKDARERAAARQFITFLAGPEVAPMLKAKGLLAVK